MMSLTINTIKSSRKMSPSNHERLYKYIKTACLTAAFFVLGLCIALIGPTLPTLAYNLGMTESSLSFIITARGCGYLFGSIMSAYLFKKMNPHLIIAISLTITAAGNFGAPFMPSAALLASVLLAAGCTMGILDTGGNVLCLALWGTESEPWMQTLHFFFAFGATLAPMLARPFIYDVSTYGEEEISKNIINTTNIIPVEISDQVNNDSSFENMDQIKGNFPYVAWAFILASAASLFVAVIFYVLTCSSRIKTESCQESTIEQEGTKFRVQILILLFIFYFLYVGTEVTFGTFIYTFAIRCQRNYTKHTGAFLNSLFWGVFAAGRFFAIFFTKCISPKSMLMLDILGTGTASAVMSFFPLYAETTDWLLWIMIALYGWSMASLFPSGISWAERYITVTGKAASFLVVGAALGEMALPFIMGLLIKHDPMNLMYFCLASSAISAMIFLALLRIANTRGSRHNFASSTNGITRSDGKIERNRVEEYSLLPTNDYNIQELHSNEQDAV